MSRILVVAIIVLLGAFTLWACNPQAAKGTDTGKTGQPAGTADPKATGDMKAPDPPKTEAAKDTYALAKEGWVNFKDPKFAGATKNVSCNSCHPYGGKDTSPQPKDKLSLIGQAKTFPKVVPMAGDKPVTLVEMINFCITNPLGGKALAEKDPLMVSMVEFHKILEPRTFEADALPVINAKCGGCHTGDAPVTGLKLADKQTAIADTEKIRVAVDSGTMPKTGKLTDKELLTLIVWATAEIDKK